MRPIRHYWQEFSHPEQAKTVWVTSGGCTPCEARDRAWGKLEAVKQADPALPQDSRWKLVAQTIHHGADT